MSEETETRRLLQNECQVREWELLTGNTRGVDRVIVTDIGIVGFVFFMGGKDSDAKWRQMEALSRIKGVHAWACYGPGEVEDIIAELDNINSSTKIPW